MTEEEIHLLRKSFAAIESQAEVAALLFYRRLFGLDPSLRPLFKGDIEEQSRKLMDMLGLALSLSANTTALESELRELGARHRTYGVRDEYYETVGQAMIGMLADVLGAQFNPRVRDAWMSFYRFMAEAMKSGAAVSQFS